MLVPVMITTPCHGMRHTVFLLIILNKLKVGNEKARVINTGK